MKRKRIISLLMAFTMTMGLLQGCSNADAAAPAATSAATTAAKTNEDTSSEDVEVASNTKVDDNDKKDETDGPKYIFLFIGDGMSYPQIQSAAYYLGTNNNGGEIKTEKLNFMDFPIAGSAQTYDSTSFAPDSASTATSISTGNKTYSGMINVDTSGTVEFETITEKLASQKDFKVGVITSVNLNHATPAAFYGHNASRGNYYDLALELVDSEFNYFAGGAFLAPTGAEEDQDDIYEVAEKAGYTVVRTADETRALKDEEKVIAVSEVLADGDSIPYNLDAEEDQVSLAEYVEKGVELLDNETGFFMMVEGGKIDWACHANDLGSTVNDVVSLSEAVDVALDFYNQHPDDTLILVTGDHETGGLTIGFAGTDYDTYLTNISNQKISYAKYDTDYVADYKENNTSFEDAMKDVKDLFGLMLPDDKDASEDSTLVLTDYEVDKLKTAYEKTLSEDSVEDYTQEEYLLYGTYEPFSVTVTHLLNNKSGISYSSYAHTGLPVPVFAIGNGEELFEGYYDNTDIFNNLQSLTEVQ